MKNERKRASPTQSTFRLKTGYEGHYPCKEKIDPNKLPTIPAGPTDWHEWVYGGKSNPNS